MAKSGGELEGILGPLESDIMEAAWKKAPITPGEMRENLAEKRPIAYTTVMTVMTRLYEKGLLNRSRSGRAFAYYPRVSKVELLGRQASDALTALSLAGPGPAVSYLVDAAASLDDDQLAMLEQAIIHLREKRQ